MRSKSLLVRLLERCTVFALGVLLLYFVTQQLFPWLHRRMPLVVALFVAYLITAYVLLPTTIRLVRLVWKPQHIPAFTYSGDGWKIDPVNIGVVATEAELLAAMQRAGWHKADKRTWRTVLRMGLSIALNRRYLRAPVSNQFLFGRQQDYAFEIPLAKSPHRRHHVRFWACVPVANPTFREHFAFWQARHRGQIVPHKILWIGAGTLDTGLAIQRRNLQITHHVAADSGKEREFIISTLKKSNQLRQVRTVRAQEPYAAPHQTFRTRMVADGNMKICELRRNAQTSKS